MSEKNRDDKNRWRNVTIAFRVSPEENDELVRGERIPYEEATKQEPDTNIKPELSFTAKVLIATIIVIFIGLMIAVIYSIRDRKRRKARCERR